MIDTMNELIASLQALLGNTYVMYFKTHSYHWNVEGINFPQYHDFFGDLYEDVYGTVDDVAENIRKLDVYAPISFTELLGKATLLEDVTKPLGITEMLQNTLAANDTVLGSLNMVFSYAQLNNKQGLADYVAGRIDTHEKHGWQLRAALKAVTK